MTPPTGAGRPTVVVIGLGPGGVELLTAQTLDAIATTPVRYLRTTRHPAAVAIAGADSFDAMYEQHDTFGAVYDHIAETLVAAAVEHGRVLYAVPGSPRVLERSVDLLTTDARVAVDVIPAMSFLDLAWVRLGIDPVEAGVRLVDGHTFAVSAAGERGPLLVAHCHNQRVLSDIKLAVDEPGDTKVTVIQRLGLPDEVIETVAWQDLDREVEADHLTSIYIPKLTAPVARELMDFYGLVQQLRAECPWDREQTHTSLRRHLIEEAYETLDAIEDFDPETGHGADDLEEELGDVLFQVFLHSVIAAEEGWFELSDVARTVHDKLHDRHPHIFGSATVDSTEELLVNWEANKLVEKGRESVMDGVARALPALSLAEKTIKKASALGLPLGDELVDGSARVLAGVTADADAATVADALIALVGVARANGIDPEMALRSRASQAGERIRRAEAFTAVSDIDVISMSTDQITSLWISSEHPSGE